MKTHAIAIAIGLAGLAGTANAGNQREVPPVQVNAVNFTACTPPDDNLTPACESLHRFIRANFSPREIGMLFGFQSSYPDYLTGGIDALRNRYRERLQEFIVTQNTAREHVVAK